MTDDGYCCAALRHACSRGTDNEGYDAVMGFEDGHWQVGEHGTPLNWCPWCGSDLTNYSPSLLRVTFRTSDVWKALEIETVEPIGASVGGDDSWDAIADAVARKVRGQIEIAIRRHEKGKGEL